MRAKLVLAGLVVAILGEHGTPRRSPTTLVAVVAAALLGAGTLSTPGVVAGAAILVLGFDRRDRVLVGLAVLFLLCFGSFYYYSLQLTLLQKSGVLVASGLLVLGARDYLTRAPAGEEPS